MNSKNGSHDDRRIFVGTYVRCTRSRQYARLNTCDSYQVTEIAVGTCGDALLYVQHPGAKDDSHGPYKASSFRRCSDQIGQEACDQMPERPKRDAGRPGEVIGIVRVAYDDAVVSATSGSVAWFAESERAEAEAYAAQAVQSKPGMTVAQVRITRLFTSLPAVREIAI